MPAPFGDTRTSPVPDPLVQPDNLIVALPTGDETEENEPPTPTLEISDRDIVKFLENCEKETMALTQQVGRGASVISKQVIL